MSLKELHDLLLHIQEYNRYGFEVEDGFIPVRVALPMIDVTRGECYGVYFRYGIEDSEKKFLLSESDEPLLTRILDWLSTEGGEGRWS